MLTGKNSIGWEYSNKGEETFKTTTAVTNTENETDFFTATVGEIDNACKLADKAFRTYRNKTGNERAEFLLAIAEQIESLGDDLINMYCKESGLPEGRAKGERGRTIGQLKQFAALIKQEDWKQVVKDAAEPDRTPFPKAVHIRSVLPIGPVAVFGASNFPLAFSTAGGDTASALAAGCPVVLKAHPLHAGTSEMVSRAIVKAAQETAMPEGVFSSINGGKEVGAHLVQHKQIKAVGFTGSYKGGKALLNLANQRKEPIPVFAEMGSINPVVISADAAAKRTHELAASLAQSITLGAGQFCTNPGLLLMIASDATELFMKALTDKIVATAPQTMLHNSIKQTYEANVGSVLAQKGVVLMGKSGNHMGLNDAGSYLARISGTNFIRNPKTQQEVFGPFSLAVVCKNEDELHEVIENLEGQLTATVIVEPNDTLQLNKLVDALSYKVGRIIYNGVPTGVEVCNAMQHGGPYPATTDARFTSVGTAAIYRWVRPICYQSFPEHLVPK